ncbi:MAG: hypothetical protein ABWK01_07660 [Infirmifilum sp.]
MASSIDSPRTTILAAFILLVIASTGTSLQPLSPPVKSYNATLSIVPCTTQVEIIANASHPSLKGQIGPAYADPNLWIVWTMRENRSLQGYSLITCLPQAPLRVEVNLSTSKPMSPNSVLAYPSVILGRKPWDKNTTTHPILPLPVTTLPQITVSANYTILEARSSYNIAYDLWILHSDETTTPGRGDIEVMIWITWRNATPLGKPSGIIPYPLMLNGTLKTINWEVWVTPRTASGWSHVAFRPQQPLGNAAITINITPLIYKALTTLKKTDPTSLNYKLLSSLQLVSIELGSEVYYAPNSHIKWELHTYTININP